MKDRALVVLRILSRAVHATVLFSNYHFSVCYHEGMKFMVVYSFLSKSIKVMREMQSLIQGGFENCRENADIHLPPLKPETGFISVD